MRLEPYALTEAIVAGRRNSCAQQIRPEERSLGLPTSKIKYFFLQKAKVGEGNLNFGALEGIIRVVERFPSIEDRGLGDFYSFEKDLVIGFPQGRLVFQAPSRQS